MPQQGLAELLAAGASTWSSPAGTRRKALVETAADDLFPLVWPHIAARLEKWPSHEELARHLCIDVAQLRAWIDRAKGQGLLRAGGASPGEQVRFHV